MQTCQRCKQSQPDPSNKFCTNCGAKVGQIKRETKFAEWRWLLFSFKQAPTTDQHATHSRGELKQTEFMTKERSSYAAWGLAALCIIASPFIAIIVAAAVMNNFSSTSLNTPAVSNVPAQNRIADVSPSGGNTTGNNDVPQPTTAISDDVPTLSPVDQAHTKAIIVSVMQDPTQPTLATRQEFWQLIDPSGQTLSNDQINRLADAFAGLAEYQRYFWQDASVSLSTGQPYKSQDRQNYEYQLLQIGVMTAERQASNDVLMAHIAAQEPVGGATGTNVVFTQQIIESTLSGINAMLQRITLLFTPPNK